MISNERCAQIVSIFAVLLSPLMMARSGESQPLQTATRLNNRHQTNPERVQIYEYNNPIRDTRTVQGRQADVHAENGNAVESSDVLSLELHMQQLLTQLVEMSRDAASAVTAPTAIDGGVQQFHGKQFGDLRSRYRNVDDVDEFQSDSYEKDTTKQTNNNEMTSRKNSQLHSNSSQIVEKLNYNESLGFNGNIVLPSSNLYSQEFQLAQNGEKKIVKLTSLVSQETDLQDDVDKANFDFNNKISEPKEPILHSNARMGSLKDAFSDTEHRINNVSDAMQMPKEMGLEPSVVGLNKIKRMIGKEDGGLLKAEKYIAMYEEDELPSATVEQKRSSDEEKAENISIKNGELSHVMKRQKNRIKEDTKEVKLHVTIQNEQKRPIKSMTAQKNYSDSEQDNDDDIDGSDEDDDHKNADDDVDAMTVMPSTAAMMHSTLMNGHTETEADNDKREEKEMVLVSADIIVNKADDDNDVDADDNARDNSKGNGTEEIPFSTVNKTSTNNEDITLDMLHKRMGHNQSTSTMQSIPEQNRNEKNGAEEHVTDVKLSKKKLAGISSYRYVNVRNDEGATPENVTIYETAKPDIFPLSYMSLLSNYVNMHSKFLTRLNKRTQNEVTTELKETSAPKGNANIVWVFGQKVTAAMTEMPQLDTEPYTGTTRMTEDHNLAEIKTTNWWRKLPYAEIRSFLNTIHT